MGPAATTKGATGFVGEWTTSSTSAGTGCPRPRSRLLSSNTVSLTFADLSHLNDANQTAEAVAEAAVVGVTDELSGQAVNAFVAIKDGNEVTDQLRKEFILQVRKSIGPFAAPKAVFIVPDLPKTRSGKMMRRILRKILAGEEDSLGDTSTVSARTSSTC